MSTPRIGRRLDEESLKKEAYEAQFGAQEADQAPPPIQDPLEPEQAALELVSYLPEDVQRLMKEASGHWHAPLWQTLLGYAMRMHDLGELFVPYRLASWEVGKKPNAPRPCGTCEQMFKSRFPDARYCCEQCFFGKLEQNGHAKDCPVRLHG